MLNQPIGLQGTGADPLEAQGLGMLPSVPSL